MRNRFDRQLEQLNNELIEMGSLIEQAIQSAVTALMRKDMDAAKNTIDFDQEVDRQEREIESLCMKLLLQQQPVARDLRLVSAALKMITDITLIHQMAMETILMVTHSIEAFVQKDLELAQSVIDHDDVVDDLFSQAKAALIAIIQENSNNCEQAADLLMAAKYFERIGDHATNIAEWVIYSITGLHDSVFPKETDNQNVSEDCRNEFSNTL